MSAICSSEPELEEAKVRWIDVLLCFDFEAKPNLVVTGARWLGEFAYVSRSGIYPGSRVGWRLPEDLFERSGLVELVDEGDWKRGGRNAAVGPHGLVVDGGIQCDHPGWPTLSRLVR